MSLTDFYVGTTKKFTVTITLNDVAVDVTGDTVILRLKSDKADPDVDAVLTSSGDVSGGILGIVSFSLSPTLTDITPKTYWYDFVWIRSTLDEYVLESGEIKALVRVSDA